jgi:hypothetical protein
MAAYAANTDEVTTATPQRDAGNRRERALAEDAPVPETTSGGNDRNVERDHHRVAGDLRREMPKDAEGAPEQRVRDVERPRAPGDAFDTPRAQQARQLRHRDRDRGGRGKESDDFDRHGRE